MNTQRFRIWLLGALLFVLTGSFGSIAQTPSPAPTNLMTFEVKDGTCTPISVNTNAGRIMFVIKMSSSTPQSIALFTVGTDKKSFLQHQQVGLSERWATMVALPVGTYELRSSLNGGKCTVMVN